MTSSKSMAVIAAVNCVLCILCLFIAHEAMGLLKNTSEELRMLSSENAQIRKELHLAYSFQQTIATDETDLLKIKVETVEHRALAATRP